MERVGQPPAPHRSSAPLNMTILFLGGAAAYRCRLPHPNVVFFDVRVGFHGNVELGILLWDCFNLRVSPVFDEPGNGPGAPR